MCGPYSSFHIEVYIVLYMIVPSVLDDGSDIKGLVVETWEAHYMKCPVNGLSTNRKQIPVKIDVYRGNLTWDDV